MRRALLAVMGTLILGTANSSHAGPPVLPELAVEPMGYTEGPAVGPDGAVYFSEAGPAHAVHRHSPEGATEVVLDASASGGANGLLWIGDRLWIAEDRLDRAVGVWSPGQAAPRTVADTFEGQRFNGPNDLAFHQPSNTLFFTDPKYGEKPFEMEVEGVYAIRLDAAGELASLTRVTDRLERPNGIAVSGDTLYVADNRAKQLLRGSISESGEVGALTLFADLTDQARFGPDGMAVLPDGRLLVVLYGQGVLVLDPEGAELGFIETGPKSSNVAAAPDGGVWVTARNGLLYLPAEAIPADEDD